MTKGNWTYNDYYPLNDISSIKTTIHWINWHSELHIDIDSVWFELNKLELTDEVR